MSLYKLNKLLEYTKDPENLDNDLQQEDNIKSNQEFIDNLYSDEEKLNSYYRDYFDDDVEEENEDKKPSEFFRLRNIHLNQLLRSLSKNKKFFNVKIIKDTKDARYRYIRAYTENIDATDDLIEHSKILDKSTLKVTSYYDHGYYVVEIA